MELRSIGLKLTFFPSIDSISDLVLLSFLLSYKISVYGLKYFGNRLSGSLISMRLIQVKYRFSSPMCIINLLQVLKRNKTVRFRSHENQGAFDFGYYTP